MQRDVYERAGGTFPEVAKTRQELEEERRHRLHTAQWMTMKNTWMTAAKSASRSLHLTRYTGQRKDSA